MDRRTVSEIIEHLDGLSWCLYSGVAVAIYADGDREIGDIDIALDGDDLYTFADRIGVSVEHRTPKKNGVSLEDHGFTTTIQDVEVEASNGFPPRRVESGTFQKIFEYRRKTTFYGVDVFVSPVEEVCILKAHLGREKDMNDLKRLNTVSFDRDLFFELLDDWQVDPEKILSVLQACGINV